jgi:hypothetical protein
VHHSRSRLVRCFGSYRFRVSIGVVLLEFARVFEGMMDRVDGASGSSIDVYVVVELVVVVARAGCTTFELCR